jgi:tripartite-type tricarboxylate transporter receptor subunit TctC
MTMQARRRALLAVALALAATGAAPVLAQSPYPSKPVRVIVPFPPGQAADTFSRMLAERLSQTWGQQVVVENRGGGGGVPGVMAVKDAAPDGYTWLVGTSGTLAVNPSVYAKIPYDPLKDFAPASNIFIVPLVVVAHPSFAPNTVQELVAAAKKAPGTINFASAGPGTAQHMTGELLKSRAGIDLVHVPYKGSGPGMTDLLGGQVPLMVDSLASALPHIKSGRIKIIAVTTAQRVPQLPNVPTIAESGYPGFEGAGWSGIVLPAGAPRDLVERISADIQKALNEPQLHDRIIERGGIPDPRTPQGYADFIRAEIEKWAQVAKTANVRLDQ